LFLLRDSVARVYAFLGSEARTCVGLGCRAKHRIGGKGGDPLRPLHLRAAGRRLAFFCRSGFASATAYGSAEVCSRAVHCGGVETPPFPGWCSDQR
jgi:hypothetical protein